MKTKELVLFLLSLCTGLGGNAQNLVNNPGFETYINTNCGGEDYFICNAPSWYILNNTPDVIHSSNSQGSSASHAPRTGEGNARFASPTNGMDEYFYGSTSALTAGQTYVISFWVRKDYTTTKNISMGLHIGTNVPSPQLIDPYIQTTIPQLRITPTTTQYVRAQTCFTAQQNGVHYLAFGAFGGNGTGENQLFLLDDISVVALQDGENSMTASLSIPQITFCTTVNSIDINGSASANEIEYKWQLYKLVNNVETFVYETPLTTGQAGTINALSLMAQANLTPQFSDCYRVYLTVYNGCSDVESVDFCFDDPYFNFITPNTPVCENVPMQLQVTGDDGWTYSWSTGQTGTGLKNITVTPTAPSVSYTVTSTTPEGCSYTQTLNLTVHPASNIAPTMNGINGDINDYTYYLHEGETVNFTSSIFNNAGETVISTILSAPNGIVVTTPPNGTNGGLVTFNWQTNYGSSGSYNVVLKVEDDNACGKLNNIYTFHIIVVCKTCPICHDFENRTPSNNPLLPSYEMAECIGAGLTEPVVIGSGNNVRFQAGSLIEMGQFFDTDGGTYEAVIEPSTCLDNCYDCCTDWNGFTYDELANPVILDTDDDDPTNDYFQLLDSGHPWCAFNAVGYHLVIVNRNNNCMLDQEVHSEECCSFQSPSPEIPWLWHSPIWWDNIIHCGSGQGHYPGNDTYFYELTLYGCNGESVSMDGYIALNDYNGMAQNSGNGEMTAQLSEQELTAQMAIQEQAALNEQLSTEVSLNPNPATDKITIQGIAKGKVEVQIFDVKGHIVIGRQTLNGFDVDVSKLSAGTYY